MSVLEAPRETVFVSNRSSGGSTTYHLFEDCHHLRQAKHVYEKDPSVLFDDMGCCTRCQRRWSA